MTLLPQEYTHFCTKCNQPFTTPEQHIVMFGDILCPECQGSKLSDWDFEIDKDWYPKKHDNPYAPTFRGLVIKDVLKLLYEEYDAIQLNYDDEHKILLINQAKKDLLFDLIKKVQEL